MNVQHFSRDDDWLTPIHIVEKVKSVLGGIDLDPASSLEANYRVGASSFLCKEADGLGCSWGNNSVSVYLNPPGGKLGNESKTRLFWTRLMKERDNGMIKHAIFMFFSVEGLAVSQGRACLPATQFPVCVPKKRIKFDHPWDGTKQQPSHSNAIVYVPGSINNTDKFYLEFNDLGDIMIPMIKKENTK